MAFDDWATAEIELLASGVRLRRPSPHTSLFKYVRLNTKTSWDHLENTLNGLVLTGATAKSLNDPFELSPCVFDDLTPRIVAAALRDTGAAESLSDDTFKLEEKYADVGAFRVQAREYLDRVERYSRILSFCERSDSPLLWSHYADSYQGACLHFLGRAFRTPRVQLGYVTYSNHRPIYPLSLALELAAHSGGHPSMRSVARLRAESEKIYFFTKASDWAYETEVRIVYNSNAVRNVQFDGDGLLAIILGPRMPDENREKVRRIVARSKFPNLHVRDARLATNSFTVEID